ncbi:MAG: TIGR02281 family clan AA aspartic protease [Gammaproteobacteria bacterium]|nr:TIGR02281 family clan AA aspartic protease [Gammaproteobacteria bacterium]
MSEHETKSIGKGMYMLGWAVFLGLMGLLFNNILDKQNNPNQSINSRTLDTGVREIQLIRNRSGHYVTPGKINNEPVTFLLDTGATFISIPANIAERLGLKKGYPHMVSTANGNIEVYSTKLKSVKIGDIEIQNLSASINPYMKSDEILLGMNMLKKLEMIQRGKTLTLRQYP